jgi:hypothetical protein
VRAEAREGLDRAALAVAQQLRPDAQQLPDRRRAGGVVGELDLRREQLRRPRRARHDRR